MIARHSPHQTNSRSSSRHLRRSLRVSWLPSRRTSCGPWMTCSLFSCMWCCGPGEPPSLMSFVVNHHLKESALCFSKPMRGLSSPARKKKTPLLWTHSVVALLFSVSCSLFPYPIKAAVCPGEHVLFLFGAGSGTWAPRSTSSRT